MKTDEEQSGCLKKMGYGCLGVIVIGVVIGALLFFNREQIFLSLSASAINFGAEKIVAEALPPEEREAVLKPIHDLTEEIRQGKVTVEQLERIQEELTKPDVIAAIGVPFFEMTLLAPSDLTEIEKEAGSLSLRRFAKGVAEGKISKAEAEAVFETISNGSQEAYGNMEVPAVKEKVTAEELRDCLKKMQTLANKAKIPNKHFKTNPGEKIRQAINRGLGRSAPPK